MRKRAALASTEFIDYKDFEFLSNYTNEQGKIFPRHLTKLTIRQQKKVAKAIKRARILSLLPFINSAD